MDIIDEINLQTGDLILFTGNTFSYNTSNTTNLGIVIKNPKKLLF